MENKNSLLAGHSRLRRTFLQKRILRDDLLPKMGEMSQTKAILGVCSGTEKAWMEKMNNKYINNMDLVTQIQSIKGTVLMSI